MSAAAQHGYLTLADIAGFAPYLAGVELEHANEILGELMDLIASRVKPMLTPATLEGGALFAYAPEQRITRGETLLELLEATYAAFRDRLDAMHRQTTCTCRACRAITTLDLKFLVHHGDYGVQRVAGRWEVVGLDVNLVRERWLKYPVSEATGWRAFVLFTDTCLAHLGVSPQALQAHTQTDSFEHVGALRTYTLDLRARYTQRIEARRVMLSEEAADCTLTFDIAAPPPVVWEWLNDPDRRTRWQPGRRWSAGRRLGGRTAPGAENHCVHGSGRLIETVLDWRPFDYFTVEITQPPGVMLETIRLEPLPDHRGTRLRGYFKLRMRLPGWLTRWLCSAILRRGLRLEQLWGRMADLIAQETAGKTFVEPQSLSVSSV
jgi:hypothetical protein